MTSFLAEEITEEFLKFKNLSFAVENTEKNNNLNNEMANQSNNIANYSNIITNSRTNENLKRKNLGTNNTIEEENKNNISGIPNAKSEIKKKTQPSNEKSRKVNDDKNQKSIFSFIKKEK